MLAIFLFYNEANGFQTKFSFSRDFKHCDLISFDGDRWVWFGMDELGIRYRVMKITTADRFLECLKMIEPLTAMICVDVVRNKKFKWSPFWVRSCNELIRYISDVDIGFTFNPYHLYNKLLDLDKKRNYEIIYKWRT